MNIRSLILVGGLSSRMNSPKHALLSGPKGCQQPLLQRLVKLHEQFQRIVLGNPMSRITISVRNTAQKIEVQHLCETYNISTNDLDFVVDELEDSGPTAGLVAAFANDQTTHWMVTGCDYPLLETRTLHQLHSMHAPDTWVTCFQNADGFHEPLIAIWSPQALQELQSMAFTRIAAGRRVGPSSAIRAFQESQTDNDQTLKVIRLQPEDSLWIKNVNTPSDWQEILPEIMVNFYRGQDVNRSPCRTSPLPSGTTTQQSADSRPFNLYDA